MIEDKFTMLSLDGPTDQLVITVRCKQCECVFDIHTFILKPKNCKHMLNESLTVVCPECKVESVTTEQEHQIQLLEKEQVELKSAITAAMAQVNVPFDIGSIDWDTMDISIKCNACSKIFVTNPRKSVNGFFKSAGMTIICPACDLTFLMDVGTATTRLLTLAAVVRLQEVESKLKKLKGAGDSAEEVTNT